MADTNTSQSNNIIGGHQAGRDVNTTYNIYSGRSQLSKTNVLKELIAKYKSEMENNVQFQEIIGELQHYMDAVDPHVVGVDGKLTLANRADQIEHAIRLKELFAKKLHKHILSKAAQELFAYLLGKIDYLFETHIRPMILEGKSRAEIDTAVMNNVIEPVIIELGNNDLDLYHAQIRGMVYFLTGNCHIKWHGEA